MSLRRGHSCVFCQQRKVRCDQQKPCSNCIRAQAECKVVAPQPARRRKKKLLERDLIERLKKYEALMTQHGIDFDLFGNVGDEATEVDTEAGAREAPPESSAQDRSSRSEGCQRRSKWFAYYDEYRTTYDLLQNSDDDGTDPPPIHHAFDKMFINESDAFPFGVGGSPTRITHLHPSAIQIFQLWQVYISNVNSLLKISHISTLQTQIVRASADLSKVSKPLEALMFNIYLIAVKSLTDEETQSTFGEPKEIMLARFNQAAQQALVNVGFMRSNELIVLQAYLLYLHSAGRNVDPRTMFCLLGIAVRMATRIGVHRDGAQFGLSPFETEQRRKLWWQLAALDKRMAEMTGSSITALSSSGSDCRLPLNVNDADLNLHSNEPPKACSGPTEMIFCLTRIELLIAADPNSIRPNSTTIKNPQKHTNSVVSPDTSIGEGCRPTTRDLDQYCSYIESVYLMGCDPKVPIQLFALMATRSALCKLHVVEFMCQGIPTSSLSDDERDALFLTAIKMLEYDDVMFTTESLRGFLWYMQIHGPLPGYIFLISELRERTTGELCERAWKAICSNHEHRQFVRNIGNPMHVAFMHATLRAWAAREEAELRLGRSLEPPNLVTLHRQLTVDIKASRKGPQPAHNEGGLDSPPVGRQSGSGRIDQTSEAIVDDNLMMPTLDPATDIYGAAFGSYDQTNWAYLMQPGVLGDFLHGSGTHFPQGGGF
ncbi:uncharacterized protein N7477_010098 [Penicillium maclennaniae]|uniref:uncharacterized protein n=1 Tax=Penicillium maclennaniae TaxID=1343394 RepID=UPI0025409694|nr:uncharacterized protein N7477_010098 [Penicillium maclennaniae]KAJ5662482.1 hypothetical protein N7477_010098 [Penicillium maclennaniae]